MFKKCNLGTGGTKGRESRLKAREQCRRLCSNTGRKAWTLDQSDGRTDGEKEMNLSDDYKVY